MALLITLAMLLTGLGLLASSQGTLRRRLGAPALSRAGRAGRRWPGAALLAVAAWPAVTILGPGLGVIFWLCAMGLAGLSVATLTGLRAHRRIHRRRQPRAQTV